VSVESRAAIGRAADARDGLEVFSFATGIPDASDVAPALAGKERVSAHVPPSQAIAMGFVGFSPDQGAADEPLHAESVLTVRPSKLPLADAIGVGFLDPEISGAFGSLHLVIKHNAAVVIDRTFSDAAAIDAFFDDQYLELANAASGYASYETFELLLDLAGYEAGSVFRVGYVVGAVPEPTTAFLLALGLALLSHRRLASR
jgi:hypothetical protein